MFLSLKLKQILPWMESIAISQTIPELDFSQICEEFIKGGMNIIKTRYMRDNLVLLTPTESDRMKDLIDMNKAWFKSVFEVVDPDPAC